MSCSNGIIDYLASGGLEDILLDVVETRASSAVVGNDKEAEIAKQKAARELSMKKAKLLRLIKHHLDGGLRTEYTHTKYPRFLWKSLNERFESQTTVLFPPLMNEWNKLRFQDFKTVDEYNSMVHKIIENLEFCSKTITEDEKLKKTYSTFHASHVLLQQQDRLCEYTKYSDLVAALLLAE
ncbi:hypothetical protein LIER_41237 [Lithospermum erythrorhizon]|uniref:Uncharacterized protein n=1 Tax=Lithospermum erythrorhizon TaxID=34254 RepID=A0AAV3R9T7_LITER